MPDPIRGVDTPNPVTPTSTGQTGSAKPADAANTANASASATSGADLADVGHTEALLQTIIQAASNTPGIDQTKVSELQQAIAKPQADIQDARIGDHEAEYCEELRRVERMAHEVVEALCADAAVRGYDPEAAPQRQQRSGDRAKAHHLHQVAGNS